MRRCGGWASLPISYQRYSPELAEFRLARMSAAAAGHLPEVVAKGVTAGIGGPSPFLLRLLSRANDIGLWYISKCVRTTTVEWMLVAQLHTARLGA